MKKDSYKFIQLQNVGDLIATKYLTIEEAEDPTLEGVVLSRENVNALLPDFMEFADSTKAQQFITDEKIEELLQKVAEVFHIPDPQSIHKVTRKREVVVARQLIHSLLKADKYGILADIGSRIGNKNHATVLHGIKTIADIIDTKDPEYYDKVKEVIMHYNFCKKFSLKV